MAVPELADVALLRTIADDLPVAIWLGTVPGGEVVYVNRVFEEILGMGPPSDASRGNYVAPYSVHTRDGAPYPEDQMPYERALRAKGPIELDDLVIHRGDRRVYLRVHAKPLYDAAGNITHILEAFDDISREVESEQARVEGEQRLRHAQRMEAVCNLAGGIAHDFNNMLAAVKILTGHLHRNEDDPSRAQILDSIDQVVDSAAKLTHALLRFARRGDAQVQPISVSELLESVANLSRRTIDRGIEIATDAQPTCVILGDAGQIEQVFMNLVVNARDAMPEGGRLRLSCRERVVEAQAWVEVEVSDTGPGIEPALRERVFEPYFTTKTSGPVKGTGLGLATVYAIVKAHAGVIEVDDTPGGGTTMRVRFPRVDARPEASAPRTRAARSERRGTLMVVDDEPPVRRAAVLALEGIGYRVFAAESGSDAVALYARHHDELDAVVLDMIMPGMNGRETYAAMRTIDDRVPVIVTSGLSLGDEARATLDAGAQAFQAKPYDINSLCETIEQLRACRSGI